MRKEWDPEWNSPHPSSEGSTFIQWKGTDVCMDLKFDCGCDLHVDAEFAYFVKCLHGHVYQLGTQVNVRRITDEELDAWGKICIVEGIE